MARQRAKDSTKEPTRAERSIERRHEFYVNRIGRSHSGRERLAHTVDFLRAVLAKLPDQHADAVADDVAQYVRRVIDHLTTQPTRR